MHFLALPVSVRRRQFHCVTMDILDVKSLVQREVRSVESVLFSRYFHFCNVLHVCNVRAIPCIHHQWPGKHSKCLTLDLVGHSTMSTFNSHFVLWCMCHVLIFCVTNGQSSNSPAFYIQKVLPTHILIKCW